MANVGIYRLWGVDHPRCDITIEDEFKPTIRELLPRDLRELSSPIRPDVVLAPEPDGPRGPEAVSVRAGDKTIGYLPKAYAQGWIDPIRRVIASGLLPVTAARIFAVEFGGFGSGRPSDFMATIRLSLNDPLEALPFNAPPADPYTMVPQGSFVKLTKTDGYLPDLLRLVPLGKRGTGFATLHEFPARGGDGKTVVEVRINDRPVGQLTAQMSARYLPMIEHLRDRGLVSTCKIDITASSVAAEVRINAARANEVDEKFLDGDPVTLSRLTSRMKNPLDYDMTALADCLRPRSLPRPPEQSRGVPESSVAGPGAMGGTASPASRDNKIRELTEIISSAPEIPRRGQFDSVRTLVLAMIGDVGDLAAAIKWVPDAAPTAAFHRSKKAAVVEARIASLAIGVFRLADLLDIDLAWAIRKKSGIPDVGPQ